MSEFLKWYRKYEKRRIFSAQYAEQHSHAAWDAGAAAAEQRVKELEAQIERAEIVLAEYRAEIERLTRKAMTE